jgi:chemotaxis protein CheY-P-specific phosphatase CheC
MKFSEEEKQAMLKLKGVGSTVISRLEEIGFSSLAELRNQEAASITKQISEMMGSTCWHNSPQARASIQAVVNLADSETVV